MIYSISLTKLHFSNARSNACSKELTQKQPCRHLEDCPPKSYEPRYINPFPETGDDDSYSGYSSQWSQVGLVASKNVSIEMRFLLGENMK